MWDSPSGTGGLVGRLLSRKTRKERRCSDAQGHHPGRGRGSSCCPSRAVVLRSVRAGARGDELSGVGFRNSTLEVE